MKTYIVYVNGNEVGLIRAGSHNAAEKKAQAKYGRPDNCPRCRIEAGPNAVLASCPHPKHYVNVAYTEV